MVSIFPPLISIMIVFIILESTPSKIKARELRPSDHGLEYYYEPDESSSEMTSFFRPPSSNELTSSSGTTLPSAVKSPMASSSKGRGDDDDNHVMNHVLIVGSLVCGLSGLALMVASALIYFLGHPKKQNSSDNSDQIHIHNNTM